MPVGRQPVETRIIHPFDREWAYQLINKEIEDGRQSFIIYPLIDKGEDEDQKAAVDEHSYLQKEVFSNRKLGLLHGRLGADEKEKVMNDFRNRKYDILVSTTVIEVGVDVPNATVMLIEGANRFGLAQLHQLRGRVGRGNQEASCVLLYTPPIGNLARERLNILRETTDGFRIAEKDLELRGPGEVLGTRQTGMLQFRVADLARDRELLERIPAVAEKLLAERPELVDKLVRRWIGDATRFAGV